MSFTLLSIAILSIFALVAAIEIYRGRNRDTVRAFMSGATVLLSLLFSVILSPIVSLPIAEALSPIVEEMPGLSEAFSGSGYMEQVITAMLAIVLSSIMFVFLFFLIRILLALAMSFLYRTRLKRQKSDAGFTGEKDSWFDRNRKTLNLVMGILNAFLITAAITAPIMGTMDVAVRSVELAEAFDEKVWENSEEGEIVDELKSFSSDVVGNIFYQFGGKQMYAAAASTVMNGKTVYLENEIDCLEGIVKDFAKLTPFFEGQDSDTAKCATILDDVCEKLEQMEACDPLLAEFVSCGAGAWLRGNRYYSIEKPPMSEALSPTFDELLRICSSFNEYNAKRNTVTLLRVSAILVDCGWLTMNGSDYESLMTLFEETDILARLKTEIDKNPEMSELAHAVSSLALGVVAVHVDELALDNLKYDELMSDLAGSVTAVQTHYDYEQK